MNRWMRFAIALALVLSGLAAGLALSAQLGPGDRAVGRPAADAGAAPVTAAATAAAPAVPQRAGGLPDFTAVAARTIEGVTNISATQIVRTASPFQDPFFRYFFGDDQGLFGWRQRPSLGSGVIVSPDGYVLTNTHVIGERRADVRVTLADRRERPARVVGLDPATDIALLKIEAENLPTIPWGDSSRLRVAEWVLAIGNPFQLNQTVTLGIVSAVGRTNLGVATYEDFIQTDAAINPGNSGGALVSARGELVGINTAIYSDTGGYQGVGFAVPSNLARRVMEELIEFGEVRRGSIGYVQLQAVTPELARELDAPDTRGALVWQMRRDAVAYTAGLRPGDIIIGFAGEPVEDPSHFYRLLADTRPGTTVTIELLRNGRRETLEVPISRARGRRR